MRVRGLALAALAALPVTAEAQLSARADVALGSAGPIPATRGLWTVGGRFDWETPRFRLGAEGEHREFASGGVGSWGRLRGSWFVPVSAPVTAELAAEASGLSAPGRDPNGVATAGGRIHLGDGLRGVWMGSLAGRDGMGAVIRWEGAAWRRFGNLTLQIQGSQTSFRELTRRISVPTDTLAPAPDTVSSEERSVHTDLGAWLRWERGALEVAGSLGRRFGITEPAAEPRIGPGSGLGLDARSRGTRSSTWWSVEGRWWFSPTVGLVGAAGYQPPDGSLQSPGGRFAKLGLSAALPRAGQRRPPQPNHADGSRRSAGALAITRLRADTVELSLASPDAGLVELMADFTEWVPVLLTPGGDGSWRLRWRLPPGRYTVNVRYDRGPWVAPPGLRIFTDDFGKETGILVLR